ncbi:hypothetical protein EWM64_g7667 [Hericium alpestre]|uniref:histone acetyltransferase n=1 Tax=Hericium alpestre TaxID=135208 RepID=A0A4Y9ZQN8_9AGAM|nr:hypothetical protein EWM64_g7667 [Hericium alpestre]
MKYLYPASNNLADLSPLSQAIKIARHSPCSACDVCPGLHPSPASDIIRDDRVENSNSLTDLAQYGSDDDDGTTSYLLSCECGHSVKDHGADERALDEDEFARRARVAVKIDEHLEVRALLRWSDHSSHLVIVYNPPSIPSPYTANDIGSFHTRQVPPTVGQSATRRALAAFRKSSVRLTDPSILAVLVSPDKQPPSPGSSRLSERTSPPPAKRRRISLSSLSDQDDDEEDRPLAAKMHASLNGAARQGTDRRSGKKTKAHTGPASLFAPPTGELQAEMNGHVAKVKVEERMDERQLDRLVTGVTVDTEGAPTSAPPVKPEKLSAAELRRGVIQIIPVENDRQPRSLVILTNLKTLFQKQLPVMPPEYIARLVYDTNSKALAICKRGYKVVGGICYRPFPHRGFAEIVFFATASVDQEKGYGGLLMDHFKAHIRRTYPEMMHFLTYADNYAVGYFKKQGFTKDITLDRSVWAGYIKDYEGGTIMQCTLLRRVDYLAQRDIVAAQRAAILSKIREMSKSHVVYEGLPQFRDGGGERLYVDRGRCPVSVRTCAASCRRRSRVDDAFVGESGWTPDMMPPTGAARKDAERSMMERILAELQSHPSAWPFMQPVNKNEVLDYYDVIAQPMDLSTMEHKLETGQYAGLDAFLGDAQLVFDNCRFYNQEGSIYWKNANKVEKHMRDLVARLRE